MDAHQLTENDIIHSLADRPSRPPINPFPAEMLSGPPRPAAVLIPFIRQDDAWHILFIRRTTMKQDPHSGQVAFPGGRCDPEDPTPETAALREAQEEVGLQPADVRILGRLEDFVTITNYQITPIIGRIPWPYPLQKAPEEVSRAFTIPLDWLADSSNRETLTREMPEGFPAQQVIYFKAYDNEILWGASARIMLNLLEALHI
ncbi:MAG: CoA pyrophosphatase [Anaerolineales bacterium]|nr:CoA pyrophosphatase [Anaerolineales bacterium]